jgi:hypothetical protein
MPETLVTAPVKAILNLLNERKLRIGGECRGELAWLFDGNPGLRMRYTNRNGITVDDFGEALYDRGYALRRLTEREILDVLERVLRPAPAQKSKERGRRRKCTADSVDELERKARAMRCRKYVCDRCNQIVRGTRNTSVLCGLCYEMNGEIRAMRRVDPLPEEILEQAAATTTAAA